MSVVDAIIYVVWCVACYTFGWFLGRKSKELDDKARETEVYKAFEKELKKEKK